MGPRGLCFLILCLALCVAQPNPKLDGLFNLFGQMAGKKGGRKGGAGDPSMCLTGQVAVPTQQPYQLHANGCGPQGMQVKEQFGLHKCCNQHDVCFGVCGTTHASCQKSFKRCMQEVCQAHSSASECQEQADGFSRMTAAFGKAMHQQSQREACDCVAAVEAPTRHADYLRRFYTSHKPEDATEATISNRLERYRGKEGELFFLLMLKYGKSAIEFQDVPGDL
eukprot:GGOE01036654.1.p1 GENE.GGOE01036654.1~~GGOE01036654.1.p1  ORF type:complete len:247 (-),score=59.75 GGOE01036654.1:195-863(-)